MNETDALTALSVLSNQTRLRMLKSLVVAGDDGLLAGEVAAAVGATPSRASFHLSAMTKAGLLRPTRASREITYRVNFRTIGDLVNYLMHDCCKNNSIVRACCAPKEGT